MCDREGTRREQRRTSILGSERDHIRVPWSKHHRGTMDKRRISFGRGWTRCWNLPKSWHVCQLPRACSFWWDVCKSLFKHGKSHFGASMPFSAKADVPQNSVRSFPGARHSWPCYRKRKVMTRHAVSQPNWRRYQLSFLKRMSTSYWRSLMTWSSKNVDVSKSSRRIWSICGRSIIPSNNRHYIIIWILVWSQEKTLSVFWNFKN